LDDLREYAGDELAILAEQTIQEGPVHGLDVDFGIAGAIIKFENEESSEFFNFGEIRKDGTFRSGYFSLKCVRLKIPTKIWQSYYDALVKLIPESKWLPYEQKGIDGKMAWVSDANGNWPSAVPLLRNRKQWFKTIEEMIDRIRPFLA